MSAHSPEIAVIGGGTGSFTLLQELKNLDVNLTAIVNMSDDGGSTGKLRDELGVLPPGDVRQCLVALSDSPDMRDVFTYRFKDGQLAGHTIGNLILSALELRHGSFEKAVTVASEILNVDGRVVPVTFDKHTLVMEDGDETVRGEYIIGGRVIQQTDACLRLDPPAALNPEAADAIERADLVVIAPGNLYGSLLPVFAVDGMATAFAKTEALKVSITNLVTKPGQTDGWHVVDYVEAFERHIGEGQLDVVLYNDTPPSSELLDKYAADGEFPVDTAAERFAEIQALAIGTSLVAHEIATQDPSDKAIRRTLIRHDAVQVSQQLLRLATDHRSGNL